MNVFFECSSHLRSFINIIFIILLWLLCTGTLVLSLHFAPHFFTPEGGCESSACFDECVTRGFPTVDIGQPVPMIMHLCDGDDCYCSTQEDNNEYAWTKGRVIKGYECVIGPVPDEGEDTYTIETCVKECIDQGFVLMEVDQHDENISDDALIFNLLVNDDCCCGGSPTFSEETYYLPFDDDEGELDDQLNTAGVPQGFDMISGSQSFATNDLGLNSGKRKYFPSAYPGYEIYEDDLEGYGPLRESSNSKPPEKKLKISNDQQGGEIISSQLQTPDPDNSNN